MGSKLPVCLDKDNKRQFIESEMTNTTVLTTSNNDFISNSKIQDNFHKDTSMLLPNSSFTNDFQLNTSSSHQVDSISTNNCVSSQNDLVGPISDKLQLQCKH